MNEPYLGPHYNGPRNESGVVHDPMYGHNYASARVHDMRSNAGMVHGPGGRVGAELHTVTNKDVEQLFGDDPRFKHHVDALAQRAQNRLDASATSSPSNTLRGQSSRQF